MKRLTAIILAIMIMLALCSMSACSQQQDPEPTQAPTEPEPQPHTVAPDTDTNEPEWAGIDRTLILENSEYTYAEGSDFLCFALTGTSDSDAKLVFKFTDEVAEMLKDEGKDTECYITMDGKKIGDAEIRSDGTVTLKGNFTYIKLCEIANEIRGIVV